MDASDVVGLARLATCNRGLHDLFSEGAVRASLERSRVASNRANRSEAQFQDLRGMLYEVAAHRDAALESARVALEQRHEVSMELRATVREQAVEGVRMRRRVRQLEQALADSQRELAEAKRARVD